MSAFDPKRTLAASAKSRLSVREPLRLGTFMGHIKNWQFEFVADAFDHQHDVIAPGLVKRRQRLVHQQG